MRYPDNMNLQRFRHFIAVAEAGNFTRAAECIGMRQPPLSQSIRRLEMDLGVTLFERISTGVVLTRSGAAFLTEAREALAAADRAASLARAADERQPAVRLGVVSLALFELLPGIIAAAADLGLALDIRYLSTNEQVDALAHGELDIGLLTPPVDAPRRMKITMLQDELLVAALPEALAGPGATISLAALQPHLVLFPRASGPALHDAISNLFRTAGLPLANHQEMPASMLATLAMVAAGIGASLVPAAVARNVSIPGLTFRLIDRSVSVPSWPVALARMPLPSGTPAAQLLRCTDNLAAIKETMR